MKAIGSSVACLCLALAALLACPDSQANADEPPGPVFVYPQDGQVLGYYGHYLFKVQKLWGADSYLWSFNQNGKMVWENYRDEGKLSGPQYAILQGTEAQRRFLPGPVEVWVRGWDGHDWSAATIIRIYLRP